MQSRQCWDSVFQPLPITMVLRRIGPRLLNVNWVVWTWGLIIVLSLILIGAMYAGLAQVMASFIPGIPIDA